MSAPQIRRSPRGGASFEVDQRIELAQQLYGTSEAAARAGYCGVAPPPAQPTPRDPAVIASDLRSAAGCLGDLADNFELGHVNEITLSSADRLLIGAGRLIMELRQRKGSTHERR
ncbi:MAG TPA: hypothetical protein VJL61_06775 [Rhodanobacteraceae bacterium]|nr:hypothetical protein [Rhodanobacteraceae bacterium]